MGAADIATLGSATLDDGTPKWQTVVQVSDEAGDTESFGEIDSFQALGFASMPWPADENGSAEAVVLRDCGGRTGVCVGARDTRNASVVGKLGPGDCAMYATGPEGQAVAQVQCKSAKRQVVLATENSKSQTMAFLLDGKNDKAQLAANGALIEIDKNGNITFCNASGAGFKIQGGKLHILAELALPGMTPGMALMQGLPTGQTPAAPVPLTPVMGVGK